jgi:hypothetical protein
VHACWLNAFINTIKTKLLVFDFTQTTHAISRDDADRFLPLYADKEFFERHPFISIHPAPRTIVKMVRNLVKDARAPKVFEVPKF